MTDEVMLDSYTVDVVVIGDVKSFPIVNPGKNNLEVPKVRSDFGFLFRVTERDGRESVRCEREGHVSQVIRRVGVVEGRN